MPKKHSGPDVSRRTLNCWPAAASRMLPGWSATSPSVHWKRDFPTPSGTCCGMPGVPCSLRFRCPWASRRMRPPRCSTAFGRPPQRPLLSPSPDPRSRARLRRAQARQRETVLPGFFVPGPSLVAVLSACDASRACFGPCGSRGGPRILRPRMARIAPAHFCAHLCIGTGPERCQVIGHSQRTPRG